MNLLAVPAVAYRWLALLALAVALLGFGWMKGAQHGERRLDEARVNADKEITRLAGERAKVTEKIVTKYVPKIAKAQVITETIIKEVDRYVPSTDCPLSPGFRVLHDAAATGEVPDPAGRTHAAAVTAKEAASTVADNYGACRADQLRLEGLQEWIREQQRVK